MAWASRLLRAACSVSVILRLEILVIHGRFWVWAVAGVEWWSNARSLAKVPGGSGFGVG